MKQFTLTTALIFYLITSAIGQGKTYFGLEFSVGNDLYKLSDNGDYLTTVPLVDAQGGITLRQEINRKLFIEAGLILKVYWQGFGFKTSPYYGSGSSDHSWLIPVRLGLSLNIYKNKVHLVPVIGYSLGINPPYGVGLDGYGTQQSATTTIRYNFTDTSNPSRYFSLLQTGIGLDFRLFRTLIFSISTNYYHGYNKIYQLNINYTVNTSAPTTGTATSKGEFWCVSTGVKYPISNFWKRA